MEVAVIQICVIANSISIFILIKRKVIIKFFSKYFSDNKKNSFFYDINNFVRNKRNSFLTTDFWVLNFSLKYNNHKQNFKFKPLGLSSMLNNWIIEKFPKLTEKYIYVFKKCIQVGQLNI